MQDRPAKFDRGSGIGLMEGAGKQCLARQSRQGERIV